METFEMDTSTLEMDEETRNYLANGGNEKYLYILPLKYGVYIWSITSTIESMVTIV